MALAKSCFLPLLFLAGLTASAADKPPRPSHPLPSKPAVWKPVPHEAYVAYWTLEAGWNTRLEIRNNMAARSLSVTPVLRTASGTENALPSVTVSPNDITEVDLRQAATAAAPQLLDFPLSFGSVVLRFNSNNAGNVFSSTIVERTGSPIAFHFDGDDDELSQTAANIESIWWLPTSTATGYLVLSNSSSKPVNASVNLTDSAGNSVKQNVGLGPAQSQRLDVRELVTRGHLQGSEGGVTISLQAGAGAVEASQIVFDDSTGLAVMMKTFDKDTSEAAAVHTIHAPMMALASPAAALGFPAGTVLDPQVFLRNSSASPLQISGAINWRSASATGQFSTPSLTLAPGELRVLHLAEYQHNGQIPADANWSTVSFSYTGRSGDLIPVASSYDSTGKYGLQTPFSEGTAAHWMGSMWHVDSTRDTLITATNGGDKPTHAAVTLYYNAGTQKYQMQQLLNPGEQMFVDVGQIIHGQLPDKNGSVIPPSTMMGSYELRDADNSAIGAIYEGKLVLDKDYGHGYYGCAVCDGYSKLDGVTWDPSPYSAAVGNGTWNTLWAYDVGVGEWDDVTPYGGSWGSTNTGVASVASEYTSLVGAGGANGLASVTLQTYNPRSLCPDFTFTPQGSITAKPVVSFTSTPPPGVAVVNGSSPGAHEVYMNAKCDPQGQVNPRFNWNILSGTSEVSTDPNNAGGPTMGFIGQQPSTSQGDVLVGLSCTDLNTNLSSATVYATLTVQKPSSLAIVSGTDSTSSSANCPSGQCGTTRQFYYQVNDQFSAPILESGIDFWDYITTGVNNTCAFTGYYVTCSGSSQVASGYQTGSCSGKTTNASGQFLEIIPLCASACEVGGQCTGSCSTGSTQTWVLNGFNVNKTITYGCSFNSVQ